MAITLDNSDAGSLTLNEDSTPPGTPTAGKVILYAKTDGFLYSKDDVGTETQLGGGGSVSEPADQIVFGTGGAVDSDADFTYVSSSGQFRVNTTNGTSGSVSVTTPGNMGLFAPSASAAATNGGTITLTGGTGNTSGAGGAMTLSAGNGGSNGNGGAFTISAGNSGATAGNSGSLILKAGATDTGTAGTIDFHVDEGSGSSDLSARMDGVTKYMYFLASGNLLGISGEVSTAGGGLTILGGEGTAGAGGNLRLASGDGTTTDGDILVYTGGDSAGIGTERLRIVGSTGAWGLAGANYGTAEQVLTSNGSASPPTWQDVSNLINEPANQIVYGTGTGITSSSTYTYNATTGALTLAPGSVAAPGASSLTAASSSTAATAGATFSITSGTGNTTAAGGNLTLTSGAGGATGSGGSASVTAGAGGATSGNGGQATIQGGASTDGNGGGISITGRNGATTTAASRSGGTLTLQAGNSTVAGAAGEINLTGGAGGATSAGGRILLTAGSGGSTSGAGGPATIQGGTATDGNGGSVAANGGEAVGTDRTGGQATLSAGFSTGTATGGVVNVTAGRGGATGAGGLVTISGGAGGTTSGAGGAVTVQGGLPTSGAGGAVNISGRAGVGGTSAGGNVTITAGAPVSTGTAGVIGNVTSGGYEYHRAGNFAVAGDAQSNMYVLRTVTTDATQLEMFLDGTGGSRRMALANDSTWKFNVHVVARRTDGNDESAGYQFEGVIDRNASAATTAIVGSLIETIVAEDTSAWSVDVTADTTNGSLRVRVTGEAAKNIRWVAFVSTVEVTG